jgi:uncharacterized HhH-GPD family protein
MAERFPVTGDETADELLATNPLALLIGMLLDQQIPMERAFLAPAMLRERLGGEFDATTIATTDPDELQVIFKGPPALHRFWGSMAKRVQALCQTIVDDYDGDPAAVWQRANTGEEVFTNLHALPGYGKEKAQIFTALLAKRFDYRPDGWREAAGPFGDDTPRSVADIGSRHAFEQVRSWKQAQRAKGLSKTD